MRGSCEVKRRCARPGTDPGKWDALPAACHSLDEAGRDPRLARLSKKRQRSRRLTPLKPETCGKLMPGFPGAQEKTGSDASAPVIESPSSATDIAGSISAAERAVCINFAHGRRCAHDPCMIRAYAVFAAALLLLLGPGLPGSRSQPAPFPLELLQIADGMFVHLGAMATMRRENAGAIANLGFIVGEEAVAVGATGGSEREGERFLAAIRP